MICCLFCRQCLQHPCVSVVAGHVSLQPPNMFCQTDQRHDDKNWKAHWRQRQDLLALFTRLEECECVHHTVLTAGTVAHLCILSMLTCHFAFLLLIWLSNSRSQTCTGWSRWWLLCLERSLLCFLDPPHKLPTKLSKPLDHPIVSKTNMMVVVYWEIGKIFSKSQNDPIFYFQRYSLVNSIETPWVLILLLSQVLYNCEKTWCNSSVVECFQNDPQNLLKHVPTWFCWILTKFL